MSDPNTPNVNQEHDEFLLAIIHDLRVHLRKSLTRSQLIERGAHASLPDDLKKQLGEIVVASREMDVLLNRLAKYAMAGSPHENSLSVPISAMLSSVVRRLAPYQVDAEIDSTLWRELSLHAHSSFELVLTELLDNALKFRNGPVKISLIVEHLPDKHVLGIMDTGIGFDQSFSKKIFRPLEKLNPVSAYPGTGLGLSICQRAVEAWGGSIWTESKSGAGSTFWFSLPVNGAHH